MQALTPKDGEENALWRQGVEQVACTQLDIGIDKGRVESIILFEPQTVSQFSRVGLTSGCAPGDQITRDEFVDWWY